VVNLSDEADGRESVHA